MSFQSKTQVSTQATPTDVTTAQRLLNAAGRGIDAAFRSLTLDTLLVRGRATLPVASIGALTVTGSSRLTAFLPVQVFQNNTVGGNLSSLGAFNKIPFNTADYDPAKRFDLTNHGIVLPTTGVYMFNGAVNISTGAAGAAGIVSLFQSTTETYRGFQFGNLAANTTYALDFTFIITYLAVSTSEWSIQVFNGDAAHAWTSNGQAGLARQTWLTVNKLRDV